MVSTLNLIPARKAPAKAPRRAVQAERRFRRFCRVVCRYTGVMNKRPIDRKRESAGMMEIEDPFDQTGITQLLVIGGQLHALKENSIYQVNLADDVDPKRTNINVPNSYQRVLDIGSGSPLVQRTLLTAHALLNKEHLSKGFDADKALSLAFSALADVAAMHEIVSAFEADQNGAVQGVRNAGHGLPIPTIGNVLARFKSFVQKADHAFQSLQQIMRLLYGNEKAKSFETLAEHVCHKYGADDPFCKLMSEALPFWKRVRAARNNVEHTIPKQEVIVKDFHLTDAVTIEVPTVEVIHPKHPTPPTNLLDFMVDTLEQLSLVFELMLASACHREAALAGGVPIGVMELSEKQKGRHRPRFAYAAYLGDCWIPLAAKA